VGRTEHDGEIDEPADDLAGRGPDVRPEEIAQP
jgi:hypothetical protein